MRLTEFYERITEAAGTTDVEEIVRRLAGTPSRTAIKREVEGAYKQGHKDACAGQKYTHELLGCYVSDMVDQLYAAAEAAKESRDGVE